MMAQCVQEEERLKNQLGDSASFAQQQAKKKNKFSKQNFKKPGKRSFIKQATSEAWKPWENEDLFSRHRYLYVLQGKEVLQEELIRIFEVHAEER
jgi:hypothetical protein